MHRNKKSPERKRTVGCRRHHYRWPCHALDRVRVVRGAVVHMTCLCVTPTYLSVRMFALYERNALALCGPHASQPPAMLRLLLAPAPVRPARPNLGAALVPFDPPPPAVGCAQHAHPAGLAACSPSGLSSLSGAPRSTPPRRLFDFRSGFHVTPSCRRYAPKTPDPARAGATVGRCLPAVHACQVWGL